MTEPPAAPGDIPPDNSRSRRITGWIWLMVAGAGLVIITLFVIGNTNGHSVSKKELLGFALAGIEVLPFVPLVVFAQLGRTSQDFRRFTLGYWCLFAAIAVFMTGLFTMAGVYDFALAEQLPFKKKLDAIASGGMAKVIVALSFATLAAFIGFLTFTPIGRKIATRILPFDPRSFTSTTALATVVVLLAISVIPLLLLRKPPMLDLVRSMQRPEKGLDLSDHGGLLGLYYQLAWAIPFAVLAAGFPISRSFSEALERLGLTRLSWMQLLVATGVAVTMVAAMSGIEPQIRALWNWMNWPVTDQHGFDELFKFAMSGWGALAVGLTAGISEELAFRGLLQPRMGLLLSNALFTSVHALQYNWDALLLVFLIGMVCGLVRRFANTTAAVIVHGLYDTLAVLFMVYLKQQGS